MYTINARRDSISAYTLTREIVIIQIYIYHKHTTRVASNYRVRIDMMSACVVEVADKGAVHQNHQQPLLLFGVGFGTVARRMLCQT